MSNKIKVLVVDDNPLLRVGLCDTVNDEKDMVVIGEAGNGRKALEMYRELKPDVVSMDYRMPNGDGLVATKSILDEYPDARIIFLSTYEGEEDIWNAWKAGARGFLSKTGAVEIFVDAVRSVSQGETYFPASIAGKLEARKEQSSLTPRERQVLELIVEGQSNKEIMTTLSLGAGTVRMHVSNVLEKLGAMDRTQAAVLAIKKGIVHLD